MNYSKMRELVENYFIYIRERNNILTNYADPTHAVHKAPKGEAHVSINKSVTERQALRKVVTDDKLRKVNAKIDMVDLNVECLNDIEKKIISYIKYGDKLTSISRTTGIERRKVARIRDKAINKMVNHANNNT